MEIKTFKAVLKQKIEEAPGIKRFILETETSLPYQAGQWGFFEFEKNGKKFSKPLSFCGCPTEKTVEFTTIISESEYKQTLDSLAAGEGVFVRGPMGNFTLKDLKDSSLCFLAGGIGITPFMSMIKFARNTGINLNAVLFYANRTPDRIAFKKDLEILQNQMQGLKVVHLLSHLSEEEQKNWPGETGYIRAELIKKYAPDYLSRHFFLVGPPPFNQAMKDLLLKDLQIPASQVISEQFAGY